MPIKIIDLVLVIVMMLLFALFGTLVVHFLKNGMYFLALVGFVLAVVSALFAIMHATLFAWSRPNAR